MKSREVSNLRKETHNQQGAMRTAKLNTNKLGNTSHMESLEVMDNAFTQSWGDQFPLGCALANLTRNIKAGLTQMISRYVLHTRTTRSTVTAYTDATNYYKYIRELESWHGGNYREPLRLTVD